MYLSCLIKSSVFGNSEAYFLDCFVYIFFGQTIVKQCIDKLKQISRLADIETVVRIARFCQHDTKHQECALHAFFDNWAKIDVEPKTSPLIDKTSEIVEIKLFVKKALSIYVLVSVHRA